MPKAKLGTIKEGKLLHYSVGAVIERDGFNQLTTGGTYLLIDRANPPFGFAGPAGHVDEGEEPAEALKREVLEEVGLEVTRSELLFEEDVYPNVCGEGIEMHHWYVYRCVCEGEPRRDVRETKSMGWYSAADMQHLKLEPVWKYWFEKLSVL